MKTRRISIETERLLIVKRHTSAPRWCADCSESAAMITVDEAAAIASASSLQIYGAAKAGRLHGCETERGSLLICFSALKHWVR